MQDQSSSPFAPSEPVGTGVSSVVPLNDSPLPPASSQPAGETPSLMDSPLAGLAQEVKTSSTEPVLIVPNQKEEAIMPIEPPKAQEEKKENHGSTGAPLPMPKKKKRNVGAIVAVIIILVMLPVGVFFVAQQRQVTEGRSQATIWKQNINPVTNTAISTSTPTPTSATTTSFSSCTDSSLLAYWPMDETSGTTVADTKGNYPATAINSPGIVDGKYGKARSFTIAGKNKVQTNSNVSFAAGAPHTVSAWVKPTGDNSTTNGIIGHGTQTTTGNGWFLAAQNASGNNVPGCYMIPLTTNSTGGATVRGSQMATNQWYKISAVYDGSYVYCYINDQFIGSAPGTAIAVNVPIVIGSIWSNYDNYYVNADIDEVKIWNTACDPGGSLTPTPTPPDMIAQWDMNDTDNVIRDATGNGHNGTATGTYSVDGLCSASKAQEFDRDAVSYISVPYSSVQNVTSNFSFETWMKFLDTSGIGFTLFNNRDTSSTTNQQYGLTIFRSSDNKIYFQAGNGTWLAAGNCPTYTTITDTNWHHFVAVQRGDKVQLYLDGSRVGDCTATSVVYNTQNNLYMGSTATQQMRTVLDTTILWGKALSESEILSRYQNKIACLTPTATPTVTATPTPYTSVVRVVVTATPSPSPAGVIVSGSGSTPTPTALPTPKTPVSGAPSVLGVATTAGGVLLLLLGLLL